MAAEASRSSSSSTSSSGVSVDSYIGSFISLTSKSDIRYEGFLFTINPQEASIGLRNVRSFGTEGRRLDGQVPASDKVYEYIVFRGSDIKDLQVKSSPPVQTAPPVHNDPAIIQSHYAAPSASSSLPTASIPGAGYLPDFGNQISQAGAPVTTYQNSVPMYPPVGNVPQWNPSPPTTNASGHSMPMYWQGYIGPSGPPQAQQQQLLRPVQGLSVPSPMQPLSTQQLSQYPSVNLSSLASNVSVSQSTELPSPLLQPVISNSLPMQPNLHPIQSSALAADPSANMMYSKAPAHVVSAVSQSSNSPLGSTMLPNVLDKSTAGPLIPNQTKPISSTSMAFNGLSESLSAAVGKPTSPALVTPGQFLQPGLTVSPTDQTEKKDVEVAQVSSVLPPQASTISVAATAAATVPVSTNAQAPLLPLPPSNARINGPSSQTRYASSQTRYAHRGGRDRRRGNEFSHPVASFTEDFDFEAMNEKFKKDEVWGHLGKNKAKADDGEDLQGEEEDVDAAKVDVKPVYKKDDFFDTLSSNALDRENRNGRFRFSEQMKLDTETFGNFPRNRGFRGGRGRGRGPGAGRGRGCGHYGRGGHYGQGNGYVERGGRGNSVYRAI